MLTRYVYDNLQVWETENSGGGITKEEDRAIQWEYLVRWFYVQVSKLHCTYRTVQTVANKPLQVSAGLTRIRETHAPLIVSKLIREFFFVIAVFFSSLHSFIRLFHAYVATREFLFYFFFLQFLFNRIFFIFRFMYYLFCFYSVVICSDDN